MSNEQGRPGEHTNFPTIFISDSVKKEQVISFCKECLCSFNVDKSTSENKRVLYAVRLHCPDRARGVNNSMLP